MKRTMFKSKIHRATVTHADLSYEGSVTIDETLMRAADILPYEKVAIWNATNGSRIETYAIVGEAGSGVICVNGAAARHAQPGTWSFLPPSPRAWTSPRPRIGSLPWCAWTAATESSRPRKGARFRGRGVRGWSPEQPG